MELQVLIIDDDEGMRAILGKAITKTPGFILVGEAENGELGLEMAERLAPQVVFMDIEMPVMDGISCAEKILENAPKTFIIFATAHEGFMPQAFELYASDYLVKPFRVERIFQTLERIKEVSTGKLPPLPQRKPKSSNGINKLIIKNKDGMVFINCNEIIFVERENNATIIHTKVEAFYTSESISSIEEKLDKLVFLRSHKSYIINLSMISKISPYGRWTYVVNFDGISKDALLTHKKFELLESLLS